MDPIYKVKDESSRPSLEDRVKALEDEHDLIMSEISNIYALLADLASRLPQEKS